MHLVGSIAAIWMVLGAAAYAEPQVKAYVQRSTVTVGRPFLLTIESSGNNIGDPQIPDVDGLNINKRANQSQIGTQVQIIGLKTSIIRTQQFGFYAQATKAGKITIPPISIEIDGAILKTDPILLNVVDNSQAAGQLPPAQANAQPGRSDKLTWDDAAFIESNVSKHEVYQGEAVLLTLRLWRLAIPGLSVGTPRGQKLQLPTTEGFYATPPQQTEDQKQRNGYNYAIAEFHQYLYPTTAGNLTIGAWHWEGYAEYGFQSQPLAFDTPPIPITVKPLPERPPDFSGAVGSFGLKAQLAHTQIAQGVPTQLVVTISGQGNPDAINAPQIPAIANVYVSDPEKDVKSSDTNGVVSVQKTFTYAVTPQQPGAVTFPEITFCYFDPVAGAYKTAKTDPIALTVVASTETTARPVMITPEGTKEKSRIDIIGQDIIPIVANVNRLRPSHASSLVTLTAAVVPMLAYAALALYMRRRRLFEHDTGYARDYMAKSKGQKRLKNVAASAEPTEELYKALIAFIADKCNVPEAGITSADARQLFEDRSVDAHLVATFDRILRACERARYASGRLSDDEVRALTDAAIPAMDRLDQALKRGRRT